MARRGTGRWLASSTLAVGYVALVARYRDSPRTQELRLFRGLNGGPELAWLRVPQQLGTPWGPVGVALVMAIRGRYPEAVAALLVVPVEKCVEVGTKNVVHRSRPFHGAPTVLRDDAPLDGSSMPSGHAALAAASAVLLAQGTSPGVAAVLGSVAVATALTRIHQGAHWPSDTLAGGVMGASIALALTAVVRRPPAMVAPSTSVEAHTAWVAFSADASGCL